MSLKDLLRRIRLRLACFLVGSHAFDGGACTICSKPYKLPQARLYGEHTPLRKPPRRDPRPAYKDLTEKGHLMLNGECVVCNVPADAIRNVWGNRPCKEDWTGERRRNDPNAVFVYNDGAYEIIGCSCWRCDETSWPCLRGARDLVNRGLAKNTTPENLGHLFNEEHRFRCGRCGSSDSHVRVDRNLCNWKLHQPDVDEELLGV